MQSSSKSEDKTSREAVTTNKEKYGQMQSIARAYLSKCECSLQEAGCHMIPELWLRKTCPGVVFANSNLPENRYRMFRSQEKISEFPEDSVDVFKRNIDILIE